MTWRLRHIIISMGFLIVTALLCGCHDRSTGTVINSNQQPAEDKEAPYIEGNKKILRWEDEEMSLFIKRYGWDMQRTGTGMYYQILTPGHGETFQEGDDITLEYNTFLLSGEMVYDSEHDGVKRFKVGRSDEIDALHEAAAFLRPGAKARLVIPSYMAYGVSGDGNKINGRVPIAMMVTCGER